jgi:hypothetical protein
VYVLIEESLHGKDGHVVAAARMQRAGEFLSTLFHIIRPVKPFLNVIMVIEATTASKIYKL